MGSILVDFEQKMEKRQYISSALFRKVQKRAPDLIPKQFKLDEYNDKVVEVEYIKQKDYFDHLLDGIGTKTKLSEAQIKAIIADEDRELIISDSSVNKTIAMTAKVKYLVEKKDVAPEDILVMSYSKRDVDNLRDNINDILKISADVTTFYSLGLRYIKKILRYKNCYVVTRNERYQIFLKYLKKRVMTSYSKIEDFADCFGAEATGRKALIGDYFRSNYGSFKNFDDYFDSYVKKQLSDTKNYETLLKRRVSADLNANPPKTLRGEHVRTKNEAMIANWLYRHSINYQYEQVFDELLPELYTYRPDFTLQIGDRKIYIDYFESQQAHQQKEEFHRKNYTNYIALDYEPNYAFLKTLREKLEEFGVHLPREQSAKNVYTSTIRQNPLSEFTKLMDFFYENIDTIKVSPRRKQFDEIIEDYLENIKNLNERVVVEKQYKYLRDFYIFYNSEIHRDADRLGFDFADMVYYAKIYIGRMKDDDFHYEYIIIDEFQDISLDCYELIRDMMERSKAKLVAVGDDWQTIYSFSGSRIEYVYNFRDYFDDAKVFKINKAHNNPHSLMDIAGDFMMKKPKQIRQMLQDAPKEIQDPFVFLDFKGDQDKTISDEEFVKVKQAIISIHKQRPDDRIAILARTNASLNAMFKSDLGFKEERGAKATLSEISDYKFDALTIHKAKGLVADWIIVIGLNRVFPNKGRPAFWLLRLFSSMPKEEEISFVGERRVFYVALTHARYKVILLRDNNNKNENTFLNEIYSAMRK